MVPVSPRTCRRTRTQVPKALLPHGFGPVPARRASRDCRGGPVAGPLEPKACAGGGRLHARRPRDLRLHPPHGHPGPVARLSLARRGTTGCAVHRRCESADRGHADIARRRSGSPRPVVSARILGDLGSAPDDRACGRRSDGATRVPHRGLARAPSLLSPESPGKTEARTDQADASGLRLVHRDDPRRPPARVRGAARARLEFRTSVLGTGATGLWSRPYRNPRPAPVPHPRASLGTHRESPRTIEESRRDDRQSVAHAEARRPRTKGDPGRGDPLVPRRGVPGPRGGGLDLTLRARGGATRPPRPRPTASARAPAKPPRSLPRAQPARSDRAERGLPRSP